MTFLLSFGVASAGSTGKKATDEVMLKQNFQDVELKTVIEAVAKLTGRNYIIDPRVKGKVTLIAPKPMSPESLNETLMSILRVHVMWLF